MKPFLIAFLLTACLTPLVIAIARRFSWIASPRHDRWHHRPTALMGGIALFGGTAATWLLCGTPRACAPLLLPAAALFLLGLVDDRISLRPHVKFVGQVAAGAALILLGSRFESLPPILSLPLTLVWIVGITNAVNLLDNMDGLAAGVSGIAALILAAYSASAGQPEVATASLALAGACAGFLVFNFSPARIFMGDCGSLFLGFSLAALSIAGTHRSAQNVVLSLLVPVAILVIPIFDTTLVSIARALNGRSITQGGRDHSSHRLVALGLSERATVLVFYALTALFGGLALASTRLEPLAVFVLAAVLGTGLVCLGFYLGFLKVYPDESQVPERVRLLHGKLWYKKQFVQVLLDVPLVPAAFVGAHLLRFEGSLSPFQAEAVVASLPAVLAAKLIGLAACRAYRGVWRCAGLADALAAVGGSTLGSALGAAAIGVFQGFGGLSRAALIIDWLLFTVLVVIARLGYVLLRQLFGMLPPQHGPRVLILGAGPEGFALAARLRDPFSPRRAAVLGVVHDDPATQHCALNGLPVLGTLADLPRLLQEHEGARCLLGVPPHSETGRAIAAFCEREGIPVYLDLDTPLAPTPRGTAAVQVA